MPCGAFNSFIFRGGHYAKRKTDLLIKKENKIDQINSRIGIVLDASEISVPESVSHFIDNKRFFILICGVVMFLRLKNTLKTIKKKKRGQQDEK